MTNEGAEPHLLIVARKEDGVDGTAMEAFEAIEGGEDFPKSFDEVLTVFTDPGADGYALGELAAGRFLCYATSAPEWTLIRVTSPGSQQRVAAPPEADRGCYVHARWLTIWRTR